MKRFISAAAAAAMIFLAGCSAKLPDGYDQFVKARETYEKLDSARVTMTDIDSGEEIMEFSFYINGNGEMVFSYRDNWDGKTQQAYSDGAEFFYKEDGDEKWTVISSADENYVYNIYNREYRYPYAEGRIFFLAAESVSDAGVIGGDDGSLSVTYVYDPDKLNAASIPGIAEEISRFEYLATRLEIGSDGIVTRFTENAAVETASGEKLSLNMQIDVTEANQISDIPNPVDDIWKPGEKPSAEAE